MTPCHHAPHIRCIPAHPTLVYLPTTPRAPGREWEDGWDVLVHAHVDGAEIDLIAAVDVRGRDWLGEVLNADAVRAAELAALSGVARCVAVRGQWERLIEEIGTFADADMVCEETDR